MITLFRRIRQKLISSGSVTKYLLYATGEITLVVVGILIALQVNNWNEQRKQADEEQIILESLYSEISSNQNVFRAALQRAKDVENAVLSILEFTGPERPILTKQKSDSLIRYFDSVITAEVNQGILNDLLVTGRIHLIRSDSLKQQLTSWIPIYNDEVLEPETRILHAVQNHIIPFLTRHYPMATENFKRYSGFESKLGKDHREVYQMLEFENLLVTKVVDYYDLINSYETMIAYNDGLLELIGGQIQKFHL